MNHPTDRPTPEWDESVAGAEMPRLPLIEEAESVTPEELKPSWRGWIHAATFPIAIAAGIVLIALSQGAATKWSAAVFMLTSLLLTNQGSLLGAIHSR